MKKVLRAPLVHLFLLVLLVAVVSGCAAPQSYVVLLPKDGHSSGEVVVTTSKGQTVLSQPWQKTEIEGNDAQPSKPALVDDPATRSEVLNVLSALPAQPARFVLYFHGNSVQLMAKSRHVLDDIMKVLRERPAPELSIVGHTDTVASESYNFELGRRRGEHVLALLKKMGAAPVRVDVTTRGECELLVQTPDRTAEPCNRRVEVTVR